jgi:ClpP class serine protease
VAAANKQMKLLRILDKINQAPWAITPSGYHAVRELINSKLAESRLDISQSDLEKAHAQSAQAPPVNPNGEGPALAVITVSGTLGQRLSLIENFCGGCDYLDIAQAIDTVLADGAEGIQFIFDSPGGMATGCGECAQLIADIPVPTEAFTDSVLCSGAYWLASGCDHITATPSADVGSIGVIIPWIDKSKLWDQLGIRYDPIISPGDTLKSTAGGPSITDEQRAYLQEKVDQVAEDFRGHILSFRELDFTELRAGSYSGNRALQLNLIDQIGSLQDAQNALIQRIQKNKQVDNRRTSNVR